MGIVEGSKEEEGLAMVSMLVVRSE